MSAPAPIHPSQASIDGDGAETAGGRLTPLSVRLFPKKEGAHAYHINGIAGRCDWAVMTDLAYPRFRVYRRARADAPRHIFLSLRSPHLALSVFAARVLPRLTRPFVLVSGSEDVTIPNQCDTRWRGFKDRERRSIDKILQHPCLLHWFAENLDSDEHRIMSPLPTGMVFPEGAPEGGIPIPHPRPLGGRPLRVLCAHRVRNDRQWDTRRHVTALARSTWAFCSTVVEQEVPLHILLKLVEEHAFVLCVEGGGLDPSPKAWQSILHGAIPIIRRTATEPAYSELPVAFVDDWSEEAITLKKLASWRDRYRPFHDTASGRSETLERLSLDYWWSKIAARARP